LHKGQIQRRKPTKASNKFRNESTKWNQFQLSTAAAFLAIGHRMPLLRSGRLVSKINWRSQHDCDMDKQWFNLEGKAAWLGI